MRYLALFALLLLIAAPSSAQDIPMRANDEARVSPNAMIMQTIGTTDVTVLYGRPSVKGRALFGAEGEALEAHGKVWRSGANEATVIRTSGPLMVAGEMLPAGTYALFTIPNEGAWTVIFNKTADQWGAYNYDESQDQLRVEVEPMEVDHTEQLTYSFENVAGNAGTLALKWGTIGVPIPMSETERRRGPE